MTHSMNRRSFVAGAAALGLCAAPAWAEEDADAVKADWLGTPPTLDKKDCEASYEADVVVLGGAVAGGLAALSAEQAGAEVAVLEKADVFHYGGFGCSFLNSKYQQSLGLPTYDPQQVLTDIVKSLCYRCDSSLWSLWAYHSGEVFDWMHDLFLEDYGIPCNTKAFGFENREEEVSPYYDTVVEMGDPAKGDDFGDFVAAVHRKLDEDGVETRLQTAAVALDQDETGRVVGVFATNANGGYEYYGAHKGVIVCTGGFGHNEAMVDAFFSPRIAWFLKNANCYKHRMAVMPEIDPDTGDGHRMMVWAGAVMEEPTHSYNAWPVGQFCGLPLLMVNQAGRRFMNEAISFLNIGQILAEQPGTDFSYWKICDQAALDEGLPSTFGMTIPRGAITGESFDVTADSIEELAERLSVDPEVLGAEVGRYNAMVEAGADTDFGKLPKYLQAVATPPFYAVKETLTVGTTMGGVHVNDRLEVVDADRRPIPGLYAAGNTVGGRFGWSYEASHIGLTNALAIVHGYFAGKNCAEQKG